jgi:hypothetical protein
MASIAAAFAAGWMCVALLAAVVRVAAAPWLVHKLSDPIGLALGAFIAAKLRARTATVLLGGLAVSQAAEFAMDLVTGAPAIHGFAAHVALIITGVAGVALGLRRPGGRSGSSDTTHGRTSESVAEAADDSWRSRRDDLANTDKGLMEMLANLPWRRTSPYKEGAPRCRLHLSTRAEYRRDWRAALAESVPDTR